MAGFVPNAVAGPPQGRDARGLSLLENLLRDIAYAWRGFRKAPGFMLTAAGAIALGVGANAGLFTILYGMALRPLPVKDPATIRNVFVETEGTGPRGQYGSRYFVSYDEFNFLRGHARTAELAAIAEQKLSWKNSRSGPLYSQLVSANLLSLIGGRPVLGRFFSAAETLHPGSAPVAVLSYASWHAGRDSPERSAGGRPEYGLAPGHRTVQARRP